MVCENLVVEPNGGDGGGGHDYSYYLLINRSSQPCSLPPSVGPVGRVTDTRWTAFFSESTDWIILEPGDATESQMSSVWAMAGTDPNCPNPGEKGPSQPVWTGFGFATGLYIPYGEAELSGCLPGFEPFGKPAPRDTLSHH